MEQRLLLPLRRLIAVACAVLLAGSAAAEPIPKRGGTLEFAVLVEPNDYDCHANISFAVLHPVAPHYSTLLRFDPANYPQMVGDLAEYGPASETEPAVRGHGIRCRGSILLAHPAQKKRRLCCQDWPFRRRSASEDLHAPRYID